MPEIVLNHLELAELVWKHEDDIEACVREIGSRHAELKLEDLCELKTLLRENFVPSLQTKLGSVRHNRARFLTKFRDWLNEKWTVILGEPKPEASPSTMSEGARAKSKDTKKACGDADSDHGQRGRGKPKSRASASASTKASASRARRSATTVGDLPAITPELFVEMQQATRISDHQLKGSMRLWQTVGNVPPYEDIVRAREVCLPSNVELRDYHNWVSLQELLDHTVRRILLSLPRREILRMPTELTLTSKWGCEGDGDPNKGRKIYFREHFWDYGVFVTALAPMKLESLTGETYFVSTKKKLLESCRPLKLELQELTSEKIREERESIQKEISELKASEVEVGDKKFIIKHEVIVTEREKRGRPQQGEASLPLRDLCDEIMDQGELIVCDLVDESKEDCHATAANDVFKSLLVASDPYFLMRQE